MKYWLLLSPASRQVPPGRPLAVTTHRRAAGPFLADGIGAELVEGIEQWSDRALAHPGHAIDDEFAVPEGKRGGQEPRGGAGVADEEHPRCGGKVPSPPSISKRFGLLVGADRDPELVERTRHVAGVVAEEGAGQGGWAIGESGDQQRAVGDALGAGHVGRARDRARDRLDGHDVLAEREIVDVHRVGILRSQLDMRDIRRGCTPS